MADFPRPASFDPLPTEAREAYAWAAEMGLQKFIGQLQCSPENFAALTPAKKEALIYEAYQRMLRVNDDVLYHSLADGAERMSS